MRKIKVNNCGDCPLCYLDDAWFMCNELDIDITKGFPEIPKNCPLKKESLKIELECEK